MVERGSAVLVTVAVAMRVVMKLARSMGMAMGVDEIRSEQQGLVVQNLSRCTGCDNPSALEDVADIGDILDQVEVVSGCDHGLPAAAATYQEVDHLAFAFGIKRSRGFIQQQNIRIEDQHRCQSDPLLFPGGEMMRRAILQMRDLHLRERLGNTAHEFHPLPSASAAARRRLRRIPLD